MRALTRTLLVLLALQLTHEQQHVDVSADGDALHHWDNWVVVLCSLTRSMTEAEAQSALDRTRGSLASCNNTRFLLATDGWFQEDSFFDVTIGSAEVEGVAATFNAAIAALPPRYTALLLPLGARLRQCETVFQDYARVNKPLALSLEAQWGELAARHPAIIVDSESAALFGPADVGLQYAAGLTSWLKEAVSVEAAAFFPPGEEAIYTESSWPRTAAPAAEMARILLLEESPIEFAGNVAALVCVYDDARFLAALLEDVAPVVGAVLVLQATRPWHGSERHAGYRAVSELLASLTLRPDLENKLSVVRGAWDSEAAQRNAGLALARSLQAEFVLLLDTDEFWHPVELSRALRAVKEHGGVGWSRATMSTYFKSIRVRVEPPEPLRILWLVALDSGDHLDCFFSEARNWACTPNPAAAHLTEQELSVEMEALGSFLHESTAVCHHLSYVRTTAELRDKLASFAHAPDVAHGWIDSVWLRWDAEPSTLDLHPTQADAFKSTVHQPLWAMPPALRRLYLRRPCDDDDDDDVSRLYCLKMPSPPMQEA